jgi:hypothetical protein
VENEEYVGFTVEQATEELGNPDHSSEILYDNQYQPTSEIEPDFSKYFSKKERENGTIIKILVWEKWRTRIVAWAKETNGHWIIFDSIEYNPTWVQF